MRITALFCLLTAATAAQDTLYLYTTPRPKMLDIKGGEFVMGAEDYKTNEYMKYSPHRVAVGDFRLSQYEVTFEEYDRYCAATGARRPDDYGYGRGKRPVIDVDWYDALLYCNWLSKEMGLQPCYTIDKSRRDPNNKNKFDYIAWTVTWDPSANGYRLPTEAEWEYAARDGGKNIFYPWGDEAPDHSLLNWRGVADSALLYQNGMPLDAFHYTSPVGHFLPEPRHAARTYPLADMAGNVWEWCWDWYEDFDVKKLQNKTLLNPTGAKAGSYRVLRGGSWYDGGPADFRACNRNCDSPNYRFDYCGFRPAVGAPVHK